MQHVPNETEVVIVGGGPAGLAVAIAARQSGLDVTVADSAQPPIDKACGEGIMPAGLDALARLGVNLAPQPGSPFYGIRFLERGIAIDARFAAGPALAVRRTVLHQVLTERAASLGVVMHWAARVSAIAEDGVVINGNKVRSRWIIGADGENSQVRRWVGLEKTRSEAHRFGFRRHYQVEPWSDCVDVHWSDRGQLYVTPVNTNEVGIAFLTRDRHLRFSDALLLFPEVARRVATATSRERGAVTATRSLRAVTRGRFALVGDASGSVDAITGDGLSIAFRQALALVDALMKNDLSLYEAEHRRIARLPRNMARLLLVMDRYPRLRRRVMAAFAAEPSLFERMLAIHAGATHLSGFGLAQTLSLGWSLLSA